jgi:nucleotide-binding universal stress UspA family protein
MATFRKILFPVDFSDRCKGAANYVEAFAGRFGSTVILLHVVESTVGQPGYMEFGGLASSLQWEDRNARAQEALDEFQREHFRTGAVKVEKRLEVSDPARTIAKIANEEGVNLIMMPTHGYGGFRRFLLGSVTAKVLDDVACPVWTGVHMEAAPVLDAISIRNILCAVDLKKASEKALKMAGELAEEYGAELTAVYAVPGSDALPERLMDMELRQDLIAKAREQLTSLCGKLGVPARIFVDAGEVAVVVGVAAQNYKADLLVMGRAQHAGLGRLRTHAYAIIRESPCPVLSV